MSNPAAAMATMTPEQIEAIVGPDVDRGPPLMVLFLTLTIFAFLFTAGRLSIRIQAQKVGADDVSAMTASAIFVGIAACVSIGAVHKTYRHIEYLTMDQAVLAIKLNTIEQVLMASTESLGKIAIALMILRIIGPTTHKWHKYFLWTLIAATSVIGIVVDVITWFQCKDPRGIWDPTVRPYTTCWPQSVIIRWATFVAVWHTVTDFVLALYPTLLLWSLKISMGKKIALCVLLGLGCLTGIFSAIKTKEMSVLFTAVDPTFDQYYLQIYACLEMFCLVVLGSVPIYKSVFDRLAARIASSKIYSYTRSLIGNSSTSSQHTPQAKTVNKTGYVKQVQNKRSQESNASSSDTAALTNKSNYVP